MKIKLSIIVPVYNVEKYLKRCIDSILNQTFKELEIILVNDGSTDNCRLICDKYKKNNNNINVIHKENGGLSSARNSGLDIARGEYVAFVDSDDYIDKNMYEILYKNAINNSSDIVICDYQKVYSNEKIINCDNYKYENIIQNYNNIQSLEQIYINPNANFVVAWNKIYKRNLFDNLRYDEGRIHEDEFIAHKLLYKSKKTTFIPIKMYYYFQRENSIVNSSFNNKKLDLVDALNERVKFLKELKLPFITSMAEKYYLEIFFNYYYKAKYKLDDIDDELNRLKNNFNKVINKDFFLLNKEFNLKEKLAILLFKINDKLYENIIINNIKKLK